MAVYDVTNMYVAQIPATVGFVCRKESIFQGILPAASQILHSKLPPCHQRCDDPGGWPQGPEVQWPAAGAQQVPGPATIDMYDTSLFTIDQIDDWDWLDDGEHGILQRNAGYATYEGSIAKYCNLMCRLPAGIGRLSGITAPSNPMSVTVNNEITPSSPDNSGSGSGGSGSGQG